MANLLEETRNLMPGRARSNWSLTEASEDDDFEYEFQQTQAMIERLNKAQPRFHAELKRLSGYDGWVSHGTGMTHGRVFVPFSTFARIDFILNHVDKKTGVIRMYRVDVEVSPRHRGPNDVREVYMQVHGTIRSQKDPFNREKDVEFNRTFSFDLGKGKKSDRYDDPKVVLAKAGPVFSEANKEMPKGMGESLEEMAAADASLDWKGAAEKLLPKRTGKSQDDLHYRAYLRAIIAGNQAQAGHLASKFNPAKDARRDLIDAVGLGESMDEGATAGMPKRLRVMKGNKKFDIDKGVSLQVDKIEPFETGAKLVLMHLNGRRSGKKDVLWVRYMKHLKERDTFNLAKGDGINKIVVQVTKRAEAVASEDVAGAPGAFAISDAPAPTMQDQVADLLDRVRNPRWEYPSWALPKVKLDEASSSKQALLKAMQEYLGVVDRAPMRVQQKKHSAVTKIVQKIASDNNMDPSDVWNQAEAAARKRGITKAMPGKDY